MKLPRLVSILAACTALTSFVSAQTVHVVDQLSGPGTDFNSIGAAVTAAVDGDIVLVRTGDYIEDVVIDGKSLVLQADFAAVVTVANVLVRNVGASGQVAIRDFVLTGGGVNGVASLRVFDNDGPIWIEDVRVNGQPMAFVAGGVHCQNSAQVVFTRCYFEPPFNLAEPITLEMQDSGVYLFDTTVRGMAGGGFPFFSFPGEHAAVMTDGSLWIYGSTVSGGAGGQGVGECGEGAAGGPAVILQGTAPVVHVLDSAVTGGEGGFGVGGCDDGPDGAAFVDNSAGATVVPVSGSARHFEITSAVRENGTIQVSLAGEPGDRVWLRFSLAQGPALSSGQWAGPFMLAVPAMKAFVVTLPASGNLVQNVTLPELGAGVEAIPFFCQAFFRDTGFIVSTPSLLVGLDQAF